MPCIPLFVSFGAGCFLHFYILPLWNRGRMQMDFFCISPSKFYTMPFTKNCITGTYVFRFSLFACDKSEKRLPLQGKTLRMCKFSESTKQKLGNAIVYIAQHTSSLSKTKLLKLLYLMEERMALKYHVPFIGLPFEVWQAGPVAKDVFIDLSDGPFLLKDFIKTIFRDGAIFVEAKADFDDSEFSECELAMMDEVLAKYGNMTASDLVAETHKESTPWYRKAAQTGLLDAFKKRECNNSSEQIDFTEFMPDCAADEYRESLAVRLTANQLNAEAHV